VDCAQGQASAPKAAEPQADGGLQLRQGPRSFLGMDWQDIHLTPEEEREFRRDKEAMLHAGRPVGICERLPTEFIKNRLRNSWLRARLNLTAAYEEMLPYAKAKAELLESSPPPKGAVAFIGSSTFTYWRDLAEDMHGWQTYNGAFGGSGIHHQVYPELFRRLVAQHKPSQIVFYCGSNDIAVNVSPENVTADFKQWHTMVRDSLGPSVRIIYISMTPSPNYLSWMGDTIIPEEAFRANELMRKYCASAGDPQLVCVDQDKDEWLRDTSYYVKDEHHFTLEAHRRLAAVIRPLLAPPAAVPDPSAA